MISILNIIAKPIYYNTIVIIIRMVLGYVFCKETDYEAHYYIYTLHTTTCSIDPSIFFFELAIYG